MRILKFYLIKKKLSHAEEPLLYKCPLYDVLLGSRQKLNILKPPLDTTLLVDPMNVV